MIWIILPGAFALACLLWWVHCRSYWQGHQDGCDFACEMMREMPERLCEREDYEVWN